jgi:peptidoglycan/LPS O-acetylase OafA/YrhL
MQNWGLTSRLDWNIPAWSISTEWFAYLVFPILLIGIGRNRDQGWILLIKLAATLSVLAGFFAIAGVSSLGENIPQLGLARCLLEFLVGAGLCRLALQTANPPILSPVLLSLTLGLVLLSLAVGLADFLLLPTAFAALIFALADHGAPFGRLIACRPLVWLGEISYSLYMIHYFVKDWLKFIGGDRAGLLSFMVYLLATLVAALALHRLVERPGRRFFRRYGITHV